MSCAQTKWRPRVRGNCKVIVKITACLYASVFKVNCIDSYCSKKSWLVTCFKAWFSLESLLCLRSIKIIVFIPIAKYKSFHNYYSISETKNLKCNIVIRENMSCVIPAFSFLYSKMSSNMYWSKYIPFYLFINGRYYQQQLTVLGSRHAKQSHIKSIVLFFR